MIIPNFWAEARLQHRTDERQITVRRFGWSNASQPDAQRQADERAAAALERLKAGEKIDRSEKKRAYNGSAGVPIREEIISRHGDTVITCNSYGARCLNTPNVLFVDIDLATAPGCGTMLVMLITLWIAAAAAGMYFGTKWIGFSLGFLALFFFYPLSQTIVRRYLQMRGGPERIARLHVEEFLRTHHDWSVRLYRTPLGLRVLAMHDLFDPRGPAASECFRALRADPVYVRMCQSQNCFRARVSPKPWRVGILDKLRGGVWPVPPEKQERRSEWVARYEAASEKFAACEYLESLGSGGSRSETRFVQQLHDDLCKANTALPIA